MNENVFNATLVSRRDFNDYLATFRIVSDKGPVPPFESGQFITIGLPREDEPAAPGEVKPPPAAAGRVRMIKRAYSIASACTIRDYYDLFIIRVDEGKLTPRLFRMKPGDKLWMDDRCKGEFTLDGVPPGKDIVTVSTGTGLAPFYSMFQSYRGQNRWRRFILINGCRYAQDLGYMDELKQTMREDPNFVYIPMATREPADSKYDGLRGRVNLLLEPENFLKHVGSPLDPAQCHIYLCGNPEMIEQVAATLTARGFVEHSKKQPGNLHIERYW